MRDLQTIAVSTVFLKRISTQSETILRYSRVRGLIDRTSHFALPWKSTAHLNTTDSVILGCLLRLYTS